MKKTILSSAMLLMGCVALSAQEKVETEYVFNPHWYIQGQFGAQYTLGEVDFGKLISPNAQIGVGYNFTPIIGARLAVNAWQSKAGSKISGSEIFTDTYKWKWNYIAPTVDVTIDLSNLLLGYNPERPVSFGIFAGLGANFAFNNDEAADANTAINNDGNMGSDQALRYLWNDNKAFFIGQFGVNVDYHFNQNWSAGIEVQANLGGDHYNSKRAGNSDWYFNALAGVKYSFGKTYTKNNRTVAEPGVPCDQAVQEALDNAPVKVVEKVVEVEKQQEIRRDVFFRINSSKVSEIELLKVGEIADYMKKYPNAKVEISGYADKGTGTSSINSKISEKRAKSVADLLQNKFGIDASRISYSSKGDSEQPYGDNDLNRVSICVAK